MIEMQIAAAMIGAFIIPYLVITFGIWCIYRMNGGKKSYFKWAEYNEL